MNEPLIDTGAPRNVLGHIISGAVASAIVSGTINYKKLKNKEISSEEAIKDTIKRTSQGAIATGSAIATTNYIGQRGGFLKALTAASIGMSGIYALELIDDRIGANYAPIDDNDIDLINEGE